MATQDAEMSAVLNTLENSRMSMEDIKRCNRIHHQDKICANSIAKELGFQPFEVEAACWVRPLLELRENSLALDRCLRNLLEHSACFKSLCAHNFQVALATS